MSQPRPLLSLGRRLGAVRSSPLNPLFECGPTWAGRSQARQNALRNTHRGLQTTRSYTVQISRFRLIRPRTRPEGGSKLQGHRDGRPNTTTTTTTTNPTGIRRNHNSTNTHLNGPEPQSFSARMKKLSREYGYAALGVYFGISALDLPLCYLGVSWAGADKVAALEHWVVDNFWGLVEKVAPSAVTSKLGSEQEGDAQAEREGTSSGSAVDAAKDRHNSGDASFWTQFALAYAIHKSFIFIRVPLTAAITPKVVKTLRGWGWNIGKKSPKSTPVVKSD